MLNNQLQQRCQGVMLDGQGGPHHRFSLVFKEPRGRAMGSWATRGLLYDQLSPINGEGGSDKGHCGSGVMVQRSWKGGARCMKMLSMACVCFQLCRRVSDGREFRTGDVAQRYSIA